MNCALKNSCLVLPARFLCNLCVDQGSSTIHESKTKIKTECLARFGSEIQNE